MNLNRSFRAQESQLLKRRQQAGKVKEKEEELALFLEMRKLEKEQELGDLLLNNSEELDAPPGWKAGLIFNITSSAPAPTIGADDFLNSDNDKNDYEWLLTPPATPLFPSLEIESQKTTLSQAGSPKARPTSLKSRLANNQHGPLSRSNSISKSFASSPGLSSSVATQRPLSSGGPGSRPATPSGRPKLTTASKLLRPSTPPSRGTIPSAKPAASITKSKFPVTRSTASTTKPSSVSSTTSAAKASSVTSTTSASKASSITTKSTLPARPSMPSRSAARSSTPPKSAARSSTTVRPTAAPSTPAKSIPRSSTSAARLTATPMKSTSRPATPTRRPAVPSSTPSGTTPPIKSLVNKSATTTSKIPVPSHGTSSVVQSRPWKPSEMPGYSLDAPPNLRTSVPDRPLSTTRGRPGATSSRSSSVEPCSGARSRRQSCSPSRGRLSSSVMHTSGSSVPAVSWHSKVSDNVSPVVIGTKMVERVINTRKLAPPKPDNKHSPPMSRKSSSAPDSSSFGRTLSKKSLDMAMRHMDIRRSIPANLRPLMTKIPASSVYSVRSGSTKSRTVSVSGSPHATSSDASSEVSVNNNGVCLYGGEIEDEISSVKDSHSPVSVQGR